MGRFLLLPILCLFCYNPIIAKAENYYLYYATYRYKPSNSLGEYFSLHSNSFDSLEKCEAAIEKINVEIMYNVGRNAPRDAPGINGIGTCLEQ